MEMPSARRWRQAPMPREKQVLVRLSVKTWILISRLACDLPAIEVAAGDVCVPVQKRISVWKKGLLG